MAYREMESSPIEDVSSLFTEKPPIFSAQKKNGVVWIQGKITGNYGYLAKFNGTKVNPHSDLLYAINGFYTNASSYRTPVSVSVNSTGIYYVTIDGTSHDCVISGCYLVVM